MLTRAKHLDGLVVAVRYGMEIDSELKNASMVLVSEQSFVAVWPECRD